MRLASTVLAIALVAVPCRVASAQDEEGAESEVARRVRREIAALPTYGVFDLLTVEVNEKGLVSLGGYAYDSSLPEAAEKAVKKVEGVREVANGIEVLPTSTSDEKIRREVYREIYLDSYLSRYGRADAPPSASSRSAFSPLGPGYRREDPLRPPIWSGRAYPAQEPVGDYAIHIVVKKGNVLLGGAVDSLADKNAAAIKAGGVLGVRKVDNELQVVPPARK
jgi:hyperosmotically inducible periplasmic protein